MKLTLTRKSSFMSMAICCLAMLTNLSKAQQWGDYTLYSMSTTSKLVDTTGTATGTTTGTAFKTWSGLTGSSAYGSYLLPGGYLLRTIKAGTMSGGGMTGRLQIVDKSGTITWDYTYASSTYNLHHDVCPMMNGNFLVICYEVKTAAEATAAGSTSNISIQSEKIMEIKPNGLNGADIVWEWHVWDHLVQNVDASKANYQSSIVNHPELLNINYKTTKDWMHMNGIDYNPVLDQIVVSSHNLNEIYVIDHSTTTAEAATHAGGNAGKGGDFLYRWGNPAAYGATGTAVLNVVHDAHWVPEGYPNGGNLVAFNNGGTSSFSTVDQVTPPLNGYNYNLTLGSAYTPTSYTSRIVATSKTSNKGNSQQLPNGNTLICIALSGLIYEVNPSGTTLWQINAGGDPSQSYRYSKCYYDNAAPAVPTITKNGNALVSSAASSYQWFKNGQKIIGATSQTYTPSADGIYLVKTTDANACIYQYSAGYKYAIVSEVEDVNLNELISIVPNPSTGTFKIEGALALGDFTVTVSDMSGQNVFEGSNTNSINLDNLRQGLYLVSINTSHSGKVVRRVSIEK